MNNSYTISKLVEELPNMDRPLLVAQWKAQFGVAPDPRLRVELMRPALAYRIQEKAAGIAKQRVQGRLQELSSNASISRFKAGTRIVREWRGMIHEVSVTESGYQYRGVNYKSLSPIAGKITGTKWSGPAFFGTKPRNHAK